jgi:hypothetical protein
MLYVVICLLVFGICFYCGMRAFWAGFVATMAVGYFYGIARANFETGYSHFLYDFGAGGYYLALLIGHKDPVRRSKLRRIMPWIVALAGWPLLLLVAPTQTLMVQLVGLRAAIFFLPFLAAGAIMEGEDARNIAYALATLNCIALIFALLEVWLGVPAFYPFNAVDQIIYRSTDVFIGEMNTFRIPAIFENSAAYGETMAASLPLLIGTVMRERAGLRRKLLFAAIGATAVSVFLSASRSNAVFLAAIGLGLVSSGRIRQMPKFGWIVLAVFLVLIIGSSARLQRFLTLQDTRYLKTRIHGSVNDTFLKLADEYPMGNGLGGGGTSMPYFLASQVRNSVTIENEYGRILLEEGLPGLALWLGLFIWTLSRPLPRKTERWYLGRWLARVALAFAFLTAPIGTGMLTAIPYTALFMFHIGWVTAPNVIRTRTSHPGTAADELLTA